MKSVLSDVNVNDCTVAFTCLQTAMIFTPNSPFPKGTQLLSLFHLPPPFLGRCNPLVPSNKTRITYPHVGREGLGSHHGVGCPGSKYTRKSLSRVGQGYTSIPEKIRQNTQKYPKFIQIYPKLYPGILYT